MKKHIVLFSSLLLVGTVMTAGAIEASAESAKTENVKETRAAVDFFEEGVGYKTDASLGNNEVIVYTHYFNILPEKVVIPEKISNPDSGEEYTVVAIGDSALTLQTGETDNVTSITLPRTIKSIGKSAFSKRKNIEKISLNTGLLSIGDMAFSGNSSVKEMILPDTVTSIGVQLFDGCSALTSIKLSNKITTIPKFVFKDCIALTSLNIPDSVESVNATIFVGATSLKTVKLSEKLTEIPVGLFKDLKSFSSIIIPDSVTKLGASAFEGTSLKAVTLPKGTVTRENLGYQAFYSNTIEKIVFTSGIDNMATNVFMEPVKKGYIFEGWLKNGETKPVNHNGLVEIAKAGNATVTAQWKVDPNAPTTSKGTSDATITLKAQQPTGTISFGDVTTDAKIIFKDVTLKGTEATTTTEDTAKSNAKVVVNDSRSDKSTGWTVEAKYQDNNFMDKLLMLSLKPTAASGTASNVDLSTTSSTVFAKGTGQADKYDIKLTPSLAIPTNFSVGASAETTKIDWVLKPAE